MRPLGIAASGYKYDNSSTLGGEIMTFSKFLAGFLFVLCPFFVFVFFLWGGGGGGGGGGGEGGRGTLHITSLREPL